jgi:hypothetical protein
MSFDLGGGGGTSFPFDNIGDAVTGTILDVEEMQETDFDSGAPKFWPDGKSIMQHRVTLQTELRDDGDDDGQRSVYLRGSRKPESKSTLSAVLAAVKATTGGSALDKGGLLTLRYVGDGVPSQRGRNAPKWYEATYRPPSVSLDGQPQHAPQNVQQPPAPAPYTTPPVQQQQPAYAPQEVAQQQPQLPPAPSPANGAAGLAGFLNGSPISPAQAAGMRAAGVVPEQLPGWVAV